MDRDMTYGSAGKDPPTGWNSLRRKYTVVSLRRRVPGRTTGFLMGGKPWESSGVRNGPNRLPQFRDDHDGLGQNAKTSQ